MNYKISFSEMNRKAEANLSKNSSYTLEEMKKQVQFLQKKSTSKKKKQSIYQSL